MICECVFAEFSRGQAEMKILGCSHGPTDLSVPVVVAVVRDLDSGFIVFCG